MLDIISQTFIAVFGVTAILCTQQSDDELKKYGCLLGMAAQPFWFYSTYVAGQWGIFALTFVFTFVWAIGIKNYWFK